MNALHDAVLSVVNEFTVVFRIASLYQIGDCFFYPVYKFLSYCNMETALLNLVFYVAAL